MTTTPLAPLSVQAQAVEALRKGGFVLVTGPLGSGRGVHARWLAAAAGLPAAVVQDPFWAAGPSDIAASGPAVLVDALVGCGSCELTEQVARITRTRPIDVVVDLTVNA